MNVYAYVNGNTANMTDPLGLANMPVWVWAAMCGVPPDRIPKGTLRDEIDVPDELLAWMGRAQLAALERAEAAPKVDCFISATPEGARPETRRFRPKNVVEWSATNSLTNDLGLGFYVDPDSQLADQLIMGHYKAVAVASMGCAPGWLQGVLTTAVTIDGALRTGDALSAIREGDSDAWQDLAFGVFQMGVGLAGCKGVQAQSMAREASLQELRFLNAQPVFGQLAEGAAATEALAGVSCESLILAEQAGLRLPTALLPRSLAAESALAGANYGGIVFPPGRYSDTTLENYVPGGADYQLFRMDERLMVEMPEALPGQNQNAAGYLRDSDYYWQEIYERHPEAFSEHNLGILAGNTTNPVTGRLVKAPVNDEAFRSVFTQYDVEYLRGAPLVHHHIGRGSTAAAVPAPLHPGSGGIHNVEGQLGIAGTR